MIYSADQLIYKTSHKAKRSGNHLIEYHKLKSHLPPVTNITLKSHHTMWCLLIYFQEYSSFFSQKKKANSGFLTRIGSTCRTPRRHRLLSVGSTNLEIHLVGQCLAWYLPGFCNWPHGSHFWWCPLLFLKIPKRPTVSPRLEIPNTC